MGGVVGILNKRGVDSMNVDDAKETGGSKAKMSALLLERQQPRQPFCQRNDLGSPEHAPVERPKVRPVAGDEEVGACLYGCSKNRRVFRRQKVVCPSKTGRGAFGNDSTPTQEVFELYQSTWIFALNVAPRLFGGEVRGQQGAVTRFG